MLPSKTLFQVLIVTIPPPPPETRKLPISPSQSFLRIPQRAEKMTKIKLARILVTSFDKSHIFALFTILVSILLCHNFDSIMLKFEVALTNKVFTKT